MATFTPGLIGVEAAELLGLEAGANPTAVLRNRKPDLIYG